MNCNLPSPFKRRRSRDDNDFMRLFAVLLALALFQAPQEPIAEPPPFDEWLQALMAEARERGYSDTLVEQALGGIEPLQRVIQNDRSQAELVVGFDRYYSVRATPAIVRRGRELARQHRSVLGRIESQYDVQRRFIIAIWGIETRYGGI